MHSAYVRVSVMSLHQNSLKNNEELYILCSSLFSILCHILSVLYSMHSLCILYALFSLVFTLHTLHSRHCFWRQVGASLSSLWPSGLLLHDSDGLDFYENESRASRLVDFVQKHVKLVQV